MKKYTEFLWEKVKYIDSSEVKEWVTCDVYEFKWDKEKDLWIIYVKSGHITPKQKILKWSKTIEWIIEWNWIFEIQWNGKLIVI